MGLLLPLAHEEPVSTLCFRDFRTDARIRPWTVFWWRLTGQLEPWHGYLVDVNASWRALEAHDAEAAAWWRENVPHMSGQTFIFPLESCEPV